MEVQNFEKIFLAEVYNAYSNPFNEKECYCKLINTLLANDAKEKLHVNQKNNEVFKKLKDGQILAKLVNIAAMKELK